MIAAHLTPRDANKWRELAQNSVYAILILVEYNFVICGELIITGHPMFAIFLGNWWAMCVKLSIVSQGVSWQDKMKDVS